MEISQEILPDEITLIPAPDPVTNNNSPAISVKDTLPETKKDESDKINVATKEKDLSIPKNITHAFKCDESEQWIKSTLREINAMIENDVWEIPKEIPKNARIINSILVYRKKEDVDIEDKELLF